MEYEVKEIGGKKAIVWDTLKHRRTPTPKEVAEAFRKEFPNTPLQSMRLGEGDGYGFLYLRCLSST
ncbi:MAG: hypothetical protein Q7S09_02200 [bacterium]|nr:hypothetical protein [bacterium]